MAVREIVKDLFKIETFVDNVLQCQELKEEGGLYLEDGSIEDSGEVTKAMKYSVLYMKSIKALQEAMTRIETLEAKVTTLEDA